MSKGQRGRQPDTTPNKKFPAKRLRQNDDGTWVYLMQENDENGNRQKWEETMDAKKRGSGKGRKADTTPGKEFTPKKIKDNGDNTAVFEIPYNDENGIRRTRTETRTVKRRGGHRKPDATPSRVFTPNAKKTILNKDDGSLTLYIPFNDSNGNRRESMVVFSVDSDDLVMEEGVPSDNSEDSELAEA